MLPRKAHTANKLITTHDFLEIVINVVTISGMDTLNIWVNYLLEREQTGQIYLKTVTMVKKT